MSKKKKNKWRPDSKNVGNVVKFFYFRMDFKPAVCEKLGEAGMLELEQRIKVEAKAVREKIKGWVNAAHDS